jgi:hypothetical protein
LRNVAEAELFEDGLSAAVAALGAFEVVGEGAEVLPFVGVGVVPYAELVALFAGEVGFERR